jgi:WD40 repeat protein
MQLALQSWEEGNTANALRLLEKHRAAPWRGFEWRHLSHLSRAGLATLRIQGDFASEVAFSPDGKRLVAEHRRVPNRSIQSGYGIHLLAARCFLSLSRRNDLWWIGGFTFLQGGRILAADCNDGVVRRWDISTGKGVIAAPKNGRLLAASSVADGKWLVVCLKTRNDTMTCVCLNHVGR